MKLYLVGGTVRDSLLGLPPSKDLDFAVEAKSFSAMRDALLGMGLVVWQEREQFGTLRGKLPLGVFDPSEDFGGLLRHLSDRGYIDADFTLCRTEATYTDNRHPDSVTPADILTDLSRRDFTVNAIAIAQNGVMVDPHGGVLDCASRALKTVGAANERFREDPLRLLRAIRFAVTRGLVPNWATLNALDAYAPLLRKLPHERVREELNKAFRYDSWSTMEWLTIDARGVGYTLTHHFPNLRLTLTSEKP